MGDVRPAMTPRPWAEGTQPTTAEFLPWLLAQSTAAQVWLLERIRHDAEQGQQCLLVGHRDLLDERAQLILSLRRTIVDLRRRLPPEGTMPPVSAPSGCCSSCGRPAQRVDPVGRGWHHVEVEDAVLCADPFAVFVEGVRA